jgi:hypothetical protein
MSAAAIRVAILASLCAACVPALAQAQQAPQQTGALQIETIDDGFVIAPDAKFTKINDQDATLAGVYGGWLTDRALLIGAGTYWLANRSDDFKMQYVGGVVRWTFGSRRALGLSTGALIGIGDATLSRPFGEVFGDVPEAVQRAPHHTDGNNTITTDTPIVVSDNFFIAEPQVTALWNVTHWMRVDFGVGYRLIGGSNVLDEQLRGASGTIAVQFGR